jgi:5'-nucleotidase (lipoprotein e(P4) family)
MVTRWRSPLVAVAGVVVGIVVGQALPPLRATPQVPIAPATTTATNPQENRVLGNLYMQSSEYRACCLQIYKVALEKLIAKLGAVPADGPPPAVVMDLDETVLDNSPFQEFLYRNRLVYKEPLWDPWERDHADEVGAVPGAKNFIAGAELAGATVVYISNRVAKLQASTVRALAHNGINVDNIDHRMFLRTEPSSDKTQRREQAAQRFRVLMFFGDSLRDFSETFKVKPGVTNASRDRLVDEAAAHWGSDWFVLPNSSYGEWERLLGDKPETHLRPTTMQAAP